MTTDQLTAAQVMVAQALIDCNALHLWTEPPVGKRREGEWFTLASGRPSPYYADVKRAAAHGGNLFMFGTFLHEILPPELRIFAGPPYAGISLAAAAAMYRSSCGFSTRYLYWRKEQKEHGLAESIIGPFEPGEHAALVEDVCTTAGSLCDARARLTAAGLVVEHAAVLVDREEGGARNLLAVDTMLHVVLPARVLVAACGARGVWTPDEVEVVNDYLDRETVA